MPRTTIADENRTDRTVERFPAVSFTQKGQQERIYAGLEFVRDASGSRLIQPWMEYVHLIKAPTIKDGFALQKVVDRESGRKDWDLEFIGQPICIGDKAIIADKGDDPGNCPACKVAREDARYCTPPTVRYAMNVLRYATRPGTWEVLDPFSAQVLVWRITSRQFTKLCEIQTELAKGQVQDGKGGWLTKDLTLADLRLGPCDSGPFYRYDIQSAEGIAVCRASAEATQFVKRLLAQPEGAKATDEQLQAACGRKVLSRGYLQTDLDRSVSQWRIALRQSGAAPTSDDLGSLSGQQGAADLTTGLDQMVTDAGAAATNGQQAPAAHPGGLEEFAAGGTPQAAAPAPPSGPVLDDSDPFGAGDAPMPSASSAAPAPDAQAPSPAPEPGAATTGPEATAPSPAAEPAGPVGLFDDLTQF
jgi:hypothetical protein